MARKSRKNIGVSVAPSAAPACYRAAAYVRLSSDDRKKRGDSLETQRNIIENFIAASPDIRLSGVYTDNNATGTNFERSGFQKMLADAECGRINCIVVKDLTRFGRNAIDAGYYLEKYLPSLNVRFIAVTDGFDSLNGDGGIMLPLKNVLSESYALDISRKCRAVQRQNIADGRFVGRMAPFGYDKSPEDCHSLIPDSDAAPIVRFIFDMAARHHTVGEIVRRLNGEKIPPPSRCKQAKGLIASEKLIGTEHWKFTTVRTILTDRVYVGDTVQGKTRKINHKQVCVLREEWICVPNTHEPIIDCELFGRVGRLLAQNSAEDKAKRSAPEAYTPNVLRGKVICAKCGHPLHRHRQNKDGTYWFRCQSQWKFAKNACVTVSVKESELKTEILTLLNIHSEAILGRYIGFENEKQTENPANAELREINGLLEKSGKVLKSLYENMVGGLITSAEFVQMKADYEAKISVLSSRADGIRNAKYEHENLVNGYAGIAEAVSAALADDKLTGEIIDRLIDRILVNPDKSFTVHFKFGDEFGRIAQ